MKKKLLYKRQRPVIDMTTLKIWKSLIDCAKDLKISRERIFVLIESNGLIPNKTYFKFNNRKHRFRLEYLDEYITGYSEEEKEQIFNDKSVSFFNLN